MKKTKLEKFYDSLKSGDYVWAISYNVKNTHRPKQYRNKDIPLLVKTKIISKNFIHQPRCLILLLDKMFWYNDKYYLNTVFKDEKLARKQYSKVLEECFVRELDMVYSCSKLIEDNKNKQKL